MKKNLTCFNLLLFFVLLIPKIHGQDLKSMEILTSSLEKRFNDFSQSQPTPTSLGTMLKDAQSVSKVIAEQYVVDKDVIGCGSEWQGMPYLKRARAVLGKVYKLKRGKTGVSVAQILTTDLTYVKFLWPGTYTDQTQAGYDAWETSSNVNSKIHGRLLQTVNLVGNEFTIVPSQPFTTAGNFYDYVAANYTIDGTQGWTFIFCGLSSDIGGTGIADISMSCNDAVFAMTPIVASNTLGNKCMAMHELGHNRNNLHPDQAPGNALGAINNGTNVMKSTFVPATATILAYEGGVAAAQNRDLATCMTVLAVDLIAFSGKSEDNKTVLNWQTATENNTENFDIEQSNDGKIFEKIGAIKARGSNSTYTFTDNLFNNSLTYYRLKINDFDATFSYSKVLNFSAKKSQKVRIFPTYTEGYLSMENVKSFEIINGLGQVVSTTSEIGFLPSGVYFVRGISTDNQPFTQRIFKAK